MGTSPAFQRRLRRVLPKVKHHKRAIRQASSQQRWTCVGKIHGHDREGGHKDSLRSLTSRNVRDIQIHRHIHTWSHTQTQTVTQTQTHTQTHTETKRHRPKERENCKQMKKYSQMVPVHSNQRPPPPSTKRMYLDVLDGPDHNAAVLSLS